jgi:hypothetical protein
MRIFLRGGNLDGEYRDKLQEVDRQFSENGEVYTPTGETTDDGFPVFQIDEEATEEYAGV